MNNLNQELNPKNLSERISPTLENVRRSCRALADSPQCAVKIDENRAREVIDDIDVEALKKYSHYPKKYSPSFISSSSNQKVFLKTRFICIREFHFNFSEM